MLYDAAACPSFNINYPPMRTLLCPGDIITYTCTFNSSSPIVIPQWTGSGFQCSNPGAAANIIQLTQSSSGSLSTVPVSCGNLSAVMTNISGTCYTSVLTIPTPQYFNGTTVTCRDGITGTLIGNDTLNIQLACNLVSDLGSLVQAMGAMQVVVAAARGQQAKWWWGHWCQYCSGAPVVSAGSGGSSAAGGDGGSAATAGGGGAALLPLLLLLLLAMGAALLLLVGVGAALLLLAADALPSAPTILSLISTSSDHRLKVTWTSVPTATSYNVSINDSVNTLVPIPSTGAPQYTFTGLTNNTVYTVSVVAINCAGSSSPATMTVSTTSAVPLLTTPTPTPSGQSSGKHYTLETLCPILIYHRAIHWAQ
ncbi:hypothetical protein EMCRGX_G015656 [Ephydatia muelleri]